VARAEPERFAFLVELLAAAEFIPVALLALPAGALADRHDRRKLLFFGQTAMMVLAAVMALVTHLHLATPPSSSRWPSWKERPGRR